MSSSDAKNAARKVGDSDAVEYGARLGYGASGVLHLLMGWITLRIAMGAGGQADQSGALQSISSTPGGGVLLWVITAGFALLAVWQLTEAVTGGMRGELSDRAKAIGKAVMYAVLTSTAFTFARGGRKSSSADTQDFTASLMSAPGGRLLIGVVGLAVIGVGGYHVYKGAKKKFLEDLSEHPPAFAVHAGRIGYVAKGIALAVVGGLFIAGAMSGSTAKTTGLDGALKTLREAPFGQVLLGIVALGTMAYGVYSFARARYAKV